MLEQVADTVCMEDMPTTELYRWLFWEFAGVADAAHLSLWRITTVCWNTGWFQTWKASTFALYSEALMFALFDFSAEEEVGTVFNLQRYVIFPLLLFIIVASTRQLSFFRCVIFIESLNTFITAHGCVRLGNSRSFAPSCHHSVSSEHYVVLCSFSLIYKHQKTLISYIGSLWSSYFLTTNLV